MSTDHRESISSSQYLLGVLICQHATIADWTGWGQATGDKNVEGCGVVVVAEMIVTVERLRQAFAMEANLTVFAVQSIR